MSLHLVTGYKGTAHITAEDTGSLNTGIFGSTEAVLDTGKKMSATALTSNTVRIYDGDLIMQGRHIRIAKDTWEDVTIESGTASMYRNDLIVVRYTKVAEIGVENAVFDVIKGTATFGTAKDPTYTTGDILSGTATLHEMPLYRVCLDGVNIASIELLVDVLALAKNVGQNDYNDHQVITSSDAKKFAVDRPIDGIVHEASMLVNSDGNTRIANSNNGTTKNYMDLTESSTKFDKPVTLASGGTGSTKLSSEAPANSIIRKHATNDQLWYTQTNNGAMYATAEDGIPKFGTLPVAQGGTGATTAKAARTNLDALGTTGNQTIENGSLFLQDEESVGKAVSVQKKNGKTYEVANLRPANSDGALVGYSVIDADGNSTQKNYLLLKEDATSLLQPLNLSSGGTGSTKLSSEAPANSIIRKHATNDQLWYTQTNNGAMYATAEDGIPKFGTLPVAQGGTGATTAKAARTNLDALGTTGNQTIENGSLFLQDEESVGKAVSVQKKNGKTYEVANLRPANSDGALVGYSVIDASGNTTQKNYLLLSEDSTTFSKPLNISGGGTGATTATAALNNLGVEFESVAFSGTESVSGLTYTIAYNTSKALKILGKRLVFIDTIVTVKVDSDASISAGKWYSVLAGLGDNHCPSIATAVSASDTADNDRMVAALLSSAGTLKVKFSTALVKENSYSIKFTTAYVA